jgi:hypothetical protein
MIGGAKFQKAVLDWSQQSNHLDLTVMNATIFMWALYAEKLPEIWRWQLSTVIGRLLLLVLLYIVYMLAGSLPALLFAVAMALTWANRPLYKPVDVKEHFNDMKISRINDDNRWFVEKALKETPKKIIQDRVSTSAIQEDNGSNTGRTSR